MAPSSSVSGFSGLIPASDPWVFRPLRSVLDPLERLPQRPVSHPCTPTRSVPVRTMPTVLSAFESFHCRIALDDSRVDRIKSEHVKLRERIQQDVPLAAKLKGVFLQGSYVQHTAVRPRENGKFDVDVVLAMDLA